jgi:hypothetical protein
MRFQKATVLVSLFVVCFVLAAQSAKADSITTFTDLTDTPTLSGTSARLTLISCSLTSLAETCTAFLLAPFLNLHAPTTIDYTLGEGTTGQISDAFHADVSALGAFLTFTSDLPTALGEANGLGPCPVVIALPTPTACNAIENGLAQSVGSITWTPLLGGNAVTDTFSTQSDVEPEPASMILFGSGLVIAGGFLRRRRQLVTPSV